MKTSEVLTRPWLLTGCLCVLFFISCATTGPNVTPMPAAPELRTLTEAPVKQQLTNGLYVVTGELVNRAAQMEEYCKKLNEWKKANRIP